MSGWREFITWAPELHVGKNKSRLKSLALGFQIWARIPQSIIILVLLPILYWVKLTAMMIVGVFRGVLALIGGLTLVPVVGIFGFMISKEEASQRKK